MTNYSGSAECNQKPLNRFQNENPLMFEKKVAGITQNHRFV